MSVYRVIISHNQTEYIMKFPTGTSSVFVFDAPSAEDIILSTRQMGQAVTMDMAGNRSANRNAGLARILSQFEPDDEDIVEFFDGDRFPVRYKPDVVDRIMREHDISCMLYTCETDTRYQKIFVPLKGATIVDTGTLCNPFYSNGFAMRVRAIRKVIEFNGGEFFMTSFNKWGCEDQYMGLVCDRLGFRVALTRETQLNGHVGGEEELHPDYRDSLQQYIDLIREKQLPVRTVSRPTKLV